MANFNQLKLERMLSLISHLIDAKREAINIRLIDSHPKYATLLNGLEFIIKLYTEEMRTLEQVENQAQENIQTVDKRV